MKIESRTLDAKQHILDEAGFADNFDRRVYFNRKTKKVFSAAYHEEGRKEEIKRPIQEDSGDKEWKFYFIGEPAGSVRRAVEASIG